MIYIFIIFFNISFCALINPIHNSNLNYVHVLFEWEQEPDAVSYNFQLSTSENFNNDNIILEHNETSTIFIEKNLIDWENTYFWRVQPIYLDGTIGSFSNINLFTTNENKFNITTIQNDEIINEGLIAFSAWDSYESGIFDYNGKEVWNDGDLDVNLIYYDNYGRMYGFKEINNNHYPVYYNHNDIFWINNNQNISFNAHEIYPLPNGNLLCSQNFITQGPIYVGNWTPFFQSIGYVADGIVNEFPWLVQKIIEIDYETKEVVWEWNPLDHINMNDYDQYTMWNIALNAGFYDWTHFNSLDFDSEDSSIYLSFRSLSSIVKIDYPTGNKIWTIGPPYPHIQSGNENICSNLEFSFQHNIQRLNNGSFLLFDNGNLSSLMFENQNNISRIIEFEIDSNNECESIFEYSLASELFSPGMGSVQKLFNNNYIINTISPSSGINGTVLEITSDKEEIFRANLNLNSPNNYRSFYITGIHPEAYNVLFNDLKYGDNQNFIESYSLKLEVHNKSEYSQPYIYSLNDVNNCFEAVLDTISISSNSFIELDFEVSCDNINYTELDFTIKPQYHDYAQKEYSFDFLYLNLDFNSDSHINIVDIVLLINYIFNNEEYNTSFDLNSDNIINILDIIFLVNFILD